MFHAILFVSGNNCNSKGRLIDGGLTGIGMFTINENGKHMLMDKLIEIPDNVTIKSQSEVPVDYFCDDIDHDDNNRKTSKYTRERIIKAAIVHEKHLHHFDNVPYFSLSELNEGRQIKTERDDDIEESGEYAFFHIGGPTVKSENNLATFQMNTNELDLLSVVIYTVLHEYEDSFANKQSYKESLLS